MAFPNITDIVTTTIENRSKEIADNVTKHNALFARMNTKGKIRTVSGGSQIYEAFNFQENSNAGWYSGYDLLPVAAQDVLSSASFSLKQLAVPVVVSGLEQLQNSGKEALLDLLEGRVGVAEATMVNRLGEGAYSDGTGSGGKQIVGLLSAAPVDPTTGTYGGIDRSVWPFWRSQVVAAGGNPTASTIQGFMNTLWGKCVRGKDKPDLIVMDSSMWGVYMASLQAIQRFTSADTAKLGFDTVKYMSADVVLDGGIGGFCPSWSCWFINTDYLHLRPHANRNMVPLATNKRYAINQDAEVQILGWAGAMTCSGAQFQGFLKGYA